MSRKANAKRYFLFLRIIEWIWLKNIVESKRECHTQSVAFNSLNKKRTTDD